MNFRWLVQEFINFNENTERMIKALKREKDEFLLVRVNADKSLTVIDNDTRLPLDDSDEIIKAFLSDAYVSIYGSKALATIINQFKVTPGSFLNEKFEMEVIWEHIHDELLNDSFIVGELQELNPPWESFFIRPTGNTKLISGICVSQKELKEWKDREDNPDSAFIGQTLMVSELREIQEEYRFFVVGGEVITGSSYMVNGVRDISIKPAQAIWEYAQKMVNRFDLATAFVIDVAKTDKGLRVVEYNNLNTSGLYGCDEYKILQAIRELYKERE